LKRVLIAARVVLPVSAADRLEMIAPTSGRGRTVWVRQLAGKLEGIVSDEDTS